MILNKLTLKRAFLRTIDVLPKKLGFEIYHSFQKRFTDSTKSKILANEKSFEITERILSIAGGVKSKSILEIGSGWMPIMPYFFKYFGDCEKIYTYDIVDHYSNNYIDELNKYFQEQFQKEINASSLGLHLPDFIEYKPNCNVITSRLPEKVDIIFSRFVLEHVTPNDIVEMHNRFFNLYGTDLLIFHLISPSDHRAFSDKNISYYDFLKYSEKEWNAQQTKFDYHNRLRLNQYLDLFEKSGIEVVHIEHDEAVKGSEKYNNFKALKLHSDYSKFTDKDLTAGSINVLLKKKS